jgi:toxin ParE1/3/4
VNPVIRPRARDDITRAISLVSGRAGRARRRVPVVDAVEASVDQLLRMPNMGAPRELRNPALKGLRVWPVTEFDEFLILYVGQGDTLRVIRVLHGKRDIDRILKKETADDGVLH